VSDDPQDVAEALDEDRVDDVDDFAGDHFGEALPGYPPDRPLGVSTDESPSPAAAAPDEPALEVGQLVDPYATALDDEPEQIADTVPATELDPEEAAMHVEEDPG
jgi:hypothetical protein